MGSGSEFRTVTDVSGRRFDSTLGYATRLINRLVQSDEKSAYRLAEMGQCSIAFCLRRSDYTIVANINDGAVSLSHDCVDADVTIRGGPADFAAMARTQRDGTALAAGKVDIEGDLAIAQQVQALMADMSIDFEALLARRTGDIVARQIGRGVRAGAQWLRQSHAVIERDVGEFLRHESRLIPAREEVERFIAERAALGEDVDRLEARIKRFGQKGRPA